MTMKHFYIGTRNQIVNVLDIYDDYKSAKEGFINVQKNHPNHQNISLKRGKSYYEVSGFGNVYNKSGIFKLAKDALKSRVDSLETEPSGFDITLKIKKIVLNDKSKQPELF